VDFFKKLKDRLVPHQTDEEEDKKSTIQAPEEEIEKMEKKGKKVALSACLYGMKCRYDGSDNKDVKLLNVLHSNDYEIILFCPEDDCFGTPRPTMDLVYTENGIKAISNLTGADLTPHIQEYAIDFFESNPDIELFVGKDRSPSCGVKSARLYDRDRSLIKSDATGVMAQVAKDYIKESIDAEEYLLLQESKLKGNQRDI
jgi:uncharacterized protein YbbK (DUF523 family)